MAHPYPVKPLLKILGFVFFVGITLIGAQGLHASSHIFLYQLASDINIPTAPGTVLTLDPWVGINLIT